MKTLKKELASIGNQYADFHGYINYRDADEFEGDMADFIRRQTQILLGRGEPVAGAPGRDGCAAGIRKL